MTTSAIHHAAVVEKFFASLAEGEAETAIACFHENAVIHEPASLPYGGDYGGREGFGRLYAAVLSLFEFAIHSWDIRETGDEAVGILEATFTSPVTGRSLRTPVVELYEFTDGLISDVVVFPYDTAAIIELTKTQ